jgi:hypothetical protein
MRREGRLARTACLKNALRRAEHILAQPLDDGWLYRCPCRPAAATKALFCKKR